jgi:type II secretory pathway predicted ATPase ExeA
MFAWRDDKAVSYQLAAISENSNRMVRCFLTVTRLSKVHCAGGPTMTKAPGLFYVMRAAMEDKPSPSLQHWGLTHAPFRGMPAVNRFYPTSSLTEALARIDYLVEGRRRVGLLTGDSGVGKSLTLKAAARQLERQGHSVVLLDATAVSPRELIWQVACGLGAAPGDDSDVTRLWRLVSDRVVENRIQQKHTVLLIDEAGHAGPDVLAHCIRLARLDPSSASRWTMVLATQLQQATRWSSTLRDLVDLRIELLPWTAEDTIGYVQMSLLEAGRMEPVFDDDALAVLNNLAQGVARDVARLADFALLAGAAARRPTVDAITVETAHEEISWTAEVAIY